MAANPFVDLAADVAGALLTLAGGPMVVAFTRPGKHGAYDRATNRYAEGAAYTFTAEAFWDTQGQTPAAEEAGAGGATRPTGKRVLVVVGRTLSIPTGEAAPALPRPKDVVSIPGEPTTYQLDAVTPDGAPAGGLAPLYRCEAAF